MLYSHNKAREKKMFFQTVADRQKVTGVCIFFKPAYKRTHAVQACAVQGSTAEKYIQS